MRLSANMDVTVWDISYFSFSWASFDATKCVNIPRKLTRHQFTSFSFLVIFFCSGDGLRHDSDVVHSRNLHDDFPLVGVWIFLLLAVSEGSEAPFGAFGWAVEHLGGLCSAEMSKNIFLLFLLFCAMHILPFHSHVIRTQCCVCFVLKSLLSSGTRLLLARSMLLFQAIKLHRRTWHFNLESFNTSHHRFVHSRRRTSR